MSLRVVERGWYARLETGNWQEIPGAKRLKLAGFDGLDLCLAFYQDTVPPEWVVTEGKTGMAVGYGSTRGATLTLAKSRLQRRQPDLHHVIEGGIRTYGLSPRYRWEEAKP